MKIRITPEERSMTIKEILYKELGLSHAQVVKLKKDERGIMLSGKRVYVTQRVEAGEILELALEDREDSINESITPVELPLDIIYEDENIICVNKCCGMPTHPSHGHHDDTLANALCFYYKKQSRPFVFRAVNRLDSETSGIVLVAKDRTSAFKLGKTLRNGGFTKKYYALLRGILEGESGCIEQYIKRKEDSIIFRTASDNGKESEYAKTLYRVLGYSDNCTLVQAEPITGRTHQLRVHFAHAGHPIIGDSLYGEPSERLMLHAFSLEFCHPATGEPMKIIAPIPGEFENIRTGGKDE